MKHLTLTGLLLCVACSANTDPFDADGSMADDAGLEGFGDGGYLNSDSGGDTNGDASLIGFGRRDGGTQNTDAGPDATTDGSTSSTADAGPDAAPATDAGPDDPDALGVCHPCSRQAQMAGLEPPCRTGLLCSSLLGQYFCFPYCDDNSLTPEPECDSAFGAGNYTCVSNVCTPKTTSIIATQACAPYVE